MKNIPGVTYSTALGQGVIGASKELEGESEGTSESPPMRSEALS
jgi:hypothetical protein